MAANLVPVWLASPPRRFFFGTFAFQLFFFVILSRGSETTVSLRAYPLGVGRKRFIGADCGRGVDEVQAEMVVEAQTAVQAWKAVHVRAALVPW